MWTNAILSQKKTTFLAKMLYCPNTTNKTNVGGQAWRPHNIGFLGFIGTAQHFRTKTWVVIGIPPRPSLPLSLLFGILYYVPLNWPWSKYYDSVSYYAIFCLLYSEILYYTILYSTLLYSTLLYSTLLYYTILYYTIPYCTISYCIVLCYIILYCTILHYTILYYTVLYNTILY